MQTVDLFYLFTNTCIERSFKIEHVFILIHQLAKQYLYITHKQLN